MLAPPGSRLAPRLLAALGLALFTALVGAPLPPPPARAATPAAISGLHVVGNQLVNGAGQPVRLLGVNRSGTEYACIQGWGLFDGPSDPASIQAIASWRTNAVRIPLNEDCWLAINGAAPAFSGANYQAAIANYVTALNTAGLVAILELHWSAPGSQQATGQNPMPDRDHSVTFWQQVANAYKTNSAVLFDLFNEPYPDSNRDTTAGWRCWRDGGTCPGVSYQVAGMQELVTAVRGTGATNVILLGGLQYSNALSQWLTYKPTDPTGNLAASWHVYNFNPCNTPSCWTTNAGPVAQQVPLIATEIGEDDGGHSFIDALMSWLDARGQSYLAWTWDTWGCGGPVLISNYNGTPCQTFGQGYKDHLAAVAGTPPPTPVPTATQPPATAVPSRTPTSPPATGVPTPTTTSGGPSLTANPGTVAPGGTETVTWSGIVSPTATDWIGLYRPGTPDQPELAWIYVSCSQTPSAPRVSGSCPFPLPAGLAPGTYELRLFSNNGYAPRLATSNSFVVGSGPSSPTPTRTPTTTPPGAGTSIDDRVMGSGTNQVNYVGANWRHCTGCGAELYNQSNSWNGTANQYLTVRFSGTQLHFYGVVDAHHGIGMVSIDGGPETAIDFYRATRAGNVRLWSSPVLADGTHTFRLRVTGTKNASSSGTMVAIDRVEIFP